MKNLFIKKFIGFLALFFILAPVFISTPLALAQGSYDFNKDSGLDQSADTGGFTTGSDAATVDSIVGRIIAVVLSMLGVVFMGFVIYGGIVWMTADGNEEKVKTANKIVMNSLFGLIIILSAYVLSSFLIKFFG